MGLSLKGDYHLECLKYANMSRKVTIYELYLSKYSTINNVKIWVTELNQSE